MFLNLTALSRGDAMRAMEPFGGVSESAADWRFTGRAVVLARPDTLTRFGERWTYESEPPEAIFANEIATVERTAALPDKPLAKPTPARPSQATTR